MNLLTKIKLSLAGALLALASFLVGTGNVPVLGSVGVSNEYVATSTGAQAQFPNYRNALQTDFRAGYGTTTPGVLGSVVITTPGTSRFCLHDATSTATNAENTSGTTTIACFGASAPAGTYTFDIAVQRGVLVEYLSADTVGWASTTITKR